MSYVPSRLKYVTGSFFGCYTRILFSAVILEGEGGKKGLSVTDFTTVSHIAELMWESAHLNGILLADASPWWMFFFAGCY